MVLKTTLITTGRIFISLLCLAQVAKGQDEIQRVTAGDYAFAKGEIQVTFTDTVSREFVNEQMNLLGYEIIDLSVDPVFLWVRNNPDEEEIEILRRDPRVDSILVEQRGITEQALQRMFERDSIPPEDQQKVRERFEEMSNRKIIRLYFHHNIREKGAQKFIAEYEDIEFRLNMVTPKTAIIKTEVGNEREVMKELKRLIYVKNTAYIAILE